MPQENVIDLSSPDFNVLRDDIDFVRVLITREDVVSKRVGRLVDQLMTLSDTKTGVINWKNKLRIGFQRMGDTAMDLSEMPHVLSYFRELTNQWPFWWHYVEKDGPTIGIVLKMLVGTERLVNESGKEILALANFPEVQSRAMFLFNKMNYLYRCHGIAEVENKKTRKLVTEAINSLFMKN